MREVRTSRRTLLLLLWLGFAAGCAGISPESRSLLQQPPSCENSEASIRRLREDHAGAMERVAHGLQGVMPPAVLVSLLRDVYGKPFRSIYLDHWRVAFGSYNEQIDQRVAALDRCPR